MCSSDLSADFGGIESKVFGVGQFICPLRGKREPGDTGEQVEVVKRSLIHFMAFRIFSVYLLGVRCPWPALW